MLLRRTVLLIATLTLSLVVAQDDLEINNVLPPSPPTTEKPEVEGNAFYINSHQIRIILGRIGRE